MGQLDMGQLTVVEVGPRDGLQNEPVVLSVDDRIQLIRRCVAAGARRIEAVSFVHPKRVPQMADAEAVMDGVPRTAGVSYAGLVLNQRGLERAVAAGVDEINVVVVASEEFSRRNQGVSVDEAIATWDRVAHDAHAAGMPRTVTIAAAFGCPFEGEVAVETVLELVRRVQAAGPDEIAFADTIGVGVPTQVRELLSRAAEPARGTPLRCHFHNTRNTGYANAFAAVEAGVVALDASVGGFGGCPFAPAATGNIATEDLLYLLNRMGLDTGLRLEQLAETAQWLGQQLDRPVPALLGRAGNFPASLPDPDPDERRAT